MSALPLRIATRGSRLALWQAQFVADRLQAATGCHVDLVQVSTTGDQRAEEPLTKLGPFGVFTREIQRAVLDGRADVAVHSLKDLPTEPTEGLILASVPQRGPSFDVLVLPDSSPPIDSLEGLPQDARIGTGSPRRRAQLLHHRPDLQMLDVRGNVETRLRKLDEGAYEALVLAEAGLRRLNLQNRISFELRPPLYYPAVGQGALGLECRATDESTATALRQITDPPTEAAVTAERRILAELRAGCHAPLGVTARHADQQLHLEAVVLSVDGRQRLFAAAAGHPDDAEQLGIRLAADLRGQGADDLVAQSRPS